MAKSETKDSEEEILDYTKQDPKNCILKYTKKIELPFTLYCMVLKDGRIGGKYSTNIFRILNRFDFSVQIDIQFNTELCNYTQMENGLLITYCEHIFYINVIKITETDYDIIQKINLFNVPPYLSNINIKESHDKKLIIGHTTCYPVFYNILMYSFNKNNNKYELSTKIESEPIDHCTIYTLKGKILLYDIDKKKIKFINTLNGKVIYSTEIYEDKIYKYKNDYLLFNGTRISIFDYKKYCFIKKYQYGSFFDRIMFIVNYILNNFIIGQKGESGYGTGQ